MKKNRSQKILSLIFFLILVFATPLFAINYTVDVFHSFAPATLQINAGDNVTWINQDDQSSHTTTSDTFVWNGTLVNFQDQFTFQFNSTGTFPYRDSIDGFTGTITVIAANSAPSVTITNPAAGATFAAPATVLIQAIASDTGGSVASVTFFVDAISIRTNTTAPYSATASNLVAGTHVFSAVATDNLGAKATNSISVNVTNSVINLSGFKLLGGQFQFNISGLSTGKTNLVQASTNLSNWISLRTNVASTNFSSFTDTQTPSFFRRFYRVTQLP